VTAAVPLQCTLPAAREAAAAIVRKWGYQGVDTVSCADLTRDGRPELTVTFASGGTAGDTGWAIFGAAGSHWKALFVQPHAYKVSLNLRAGDAIEVQPIYRKNDSNCCPTGGFQHRRYHWDGKRFVIAKTWLTKTFAP
jgi:hypothetical protein